MRLGVSAALVNGELIDGDVEIEGGEVAGVGLAAAGGSGIAAPGFVDLQVNGVAGVDFLSAEPGDYRRATQAMAAAGVVAFQPTFVSSPPEAYRRAGASAATAQAELSRLPLPRILGVHLEGPFLAPRWAGAHDPESLRRPDLRLATELCDLAPVTMVTLAPELDGAPELIDRFVADGVVVSCGHSDADADAAHRAFEGGARAITHIHNAHRRWRPRDPGLGGVAVARDGVYVQAIADGVHLAPETLLATFLATPGRFCLVTDAIAAAGLGPGEYRLGSTRVRADDDAARLPDGTLAGSLLTMDRAVRNLVAAGAPLHGALPAASRTPARLIASGRHGSIAPGAAADVVVLDDELRVRRTLVGGVEAFAA